jgi:glycolate oxidase
MFTPDDLATMGLVRQAFDPQNRANPEKIFPTPRTCGESARRRTEVPQLAAVEVF